MKMITHKKRKIIITTIVFHAAFFFAQQGVNAKLCTPNGTGMCMLTKSVTVETDLAKEREFFLVATKKTIVETTKARRVIDKIEKEEMTLAAKLAGEFFDLREHIILKAKEAGMLLQVPNMAIEFIGSCGLKEEWNKVCTHYRTKLCIKKQKGIPYRKPFVSCSEES